MGNVVKLYKVKDQSTGLYRKPGGGWSKTGKTWNNIGHLKSSLHAEGLMREGCVLPDRDIIIIEIVVQETIGNTIVLADMIEKFNRFAGLNKKYGTSFSTLVDRIEKDGQQDIWTWCLIIPYTLGKSAAWEETTLKLLKSLKLKQNTDFRKSSASGLALAFKTKEAAMRVRLAIPSDIKVIGLDIKDFVESNIDESE